MTATSSDFLADIIIVGAGLAGLTTAVSLAMRGKQAGLIYDLGDTRAATPACHGISTIKGILESDQDLFGLKLEGHRGFSDWLMGLESYLGVSRPKEAWIEGVREGFAGRAEFTKDFGRIYRRDFIGAKQVLLDTAGKLNFADAFYPADWWIDPEYLVKILWSCVKKLGIKIVDATVIKIFRTEQGVRLSAGEESFAANKIILCAGAGTEQILRLSEFQSDGWIAVSGYTFKAPYTGKKDCVVKGTTGLSISDGRIHWGSTSDVSKKLPSKEPFKWRTGLQESALASEYLAKIDPQYVRVAITENAIRWGVRVRTKSRAPALCRAADLQGLELKNIWINAGYYKSGIILSWLLAARLADELEAIT